MSQDTGSQGNDGVVLVVGVDLTDVSEHLLASARDLARTSGSTLMHVVHVVTPEPAPRLFAAPHHAVGLEEQAHVESAQWELKRLCQAIVAGSGARWVIHTPIGDVADELTRIAREAHAHVLVVESHDPTPGILAQSLLARIARRAPCSVLTLRQRARHFVTPRDAMPRASGA